MVLGDGETAALVRSLVQHAVSAALAFFVSLWARNRPRASPLVPKFILAVIPLWLLMSVDSLLNVVLRPPPLHPEIYMPHAERDWTFRPGSFGTYLNQPVHINAHGLPGPEIPYERSEPEHRVLLLGDSVTVGFGVPESDTFAAILSTRLPARPPQTRVTIVNCAVTSYSPWQQVNLLANEGIQHQPDVVVHVFCLNDYVEKFLLSRFGGNSSGPYEFVSPLLRRSGLYRAAREIRKRSRRSAGQRRNELIDRFAVSRLIQDPDAPHLKNAWKLTFDNMSKIVDLARQNDLPFAIVCFPYAMQIRPGAVQHPAPQVRLAEFARRHDVPYLDLLPVFRTYARENALEPSELFLDASHPTTLGHALAAREIRQFLVEHHLVP
jgi:lysophospholipase L1-like esterase